MDRLVVARLLAGDDDRAYVRAEMDKARRMGIAGVPAFILDGRHLVSGAQPSETLAAIIDRVRAEAA